MARRRRRRRRRLSALVPVLFILVLALMAIVGMLIFTRAKEAKEPKYTYVSMTEEAAARAYVWLSEIDDCNITYDDLKAIMGDFNMEIVETPTGEKGIYTKALADGSYEYCLSQAKTGLERAYRQVVINRLMVAGGIEGEVTDATVEELMMEEYGVSVSEYLEGQNIDIFPSLDELNQKYSGEVNYNED